MRLPLQVSTRPGGLRIRFLAAIIDGIIMAIPCAIINVIFKSITATVSPGDVSSPFAVFSFILSALIGVLISLAYHAYYYQSTGATIGKKLFLLKVIDSTTRGLVDLQTGFLARSDREIFVVADLDDRLHHGRRAPR